MSNSITLHPKLGVNPRMFDVVCPVCGENHPAILLLGTRNYIDTCNGCGLQHIGGVSWPAPRELPTCRCGSTNFTRRQLGEFESSVGGTNQVCDKCHGYMQQGIILVSTRDGETGQNPYRTGGFWVVKEAAIRRIVHPPELMEAICQKRMAFLENKVCTALGLPGAEQLSNDPKPAEPASQESPNVQARTSQEPHPADEECG